MNIIEEILYLLVNPLKNLIYSIDLDLWHNPRIFYIGRLKMNLFCMNCCQNIRKMIKTEKLWYSIFKKQNHFTCIWIFSSSLSYTVIQWKSLESYDMCTVTINMYYNYIQPPFAVWYVGSQLLHNLKHTNFSILLAHFMAYLWYFILLYFIYVYNLRRKNISLLPKCKSIQFQIFFLIIIEQ